MCLDCGCNMPDENHGDSRHILMKDIIEASKADGKAPPEAYDTMKKTYEKVVSGKIKSKAWPPQQ